MATRKQSRSKSPPIEGIVIYRGEGLMFNVTPVGGSGDEWCVKTTSPTTQRVARLLKKLGLDKED